MEELIKHTRHIRQNILRQVYAAQSGHPGGSLSAVELLTVLYFQVMDVNERNVDTLNRDRFVLSKGHASPLLYAVLAEKGLLKKNELTGFRSLDSKLQGHPNMRYVSGVDMSTGSLGQGISCAVGMALANKLDQNPHRVYVLIGDGECEEGQVWEACMAAAHYQLDNLCVILDYNHLQIDGNIQDVIGPEPFRSKFEAFGFYVIEIDGHDLTAIQSAFEQAKSVKGKPTLILAHTVKGKGVSFMENEAGWHGAAPNRAQYDQAMKELGGESE